MKNIETLESTALVSFGRPADADTTPARAVRPNASFVTQLIATAAMVPQTRKLQRATPADALSGYGVTLAETAKHATPTGARLIRII